MQHIEKKNKRRETADSALPSQLKQQRLKKWPTNHLKQVQQQPCYSFMSTSALPECSVKTCQNLSCSQHEFGFGHFTSEHFSFFVSCEVLESLYSISSASDRPAQPITALTTASYLPKLVFASLPQKMLSIRSYRGNQTESPQ